MIADDDLRLPKGLRLALLIGAGFLTVWNALFHRPPPKKRPQHKYDWYHCLVPGCYTLIPPKRIMCLEHWVQIPVPMRMKLVHDAKTLSAQGVDRPPPAWNHLAQTAIAFVRDGEMPSW